MKSLLTLPNGSVYAATYGHGIIKIHEEKKRNQLKVAEREDFPSFPPIPSIKTRDELNQEAVKLNQVVDEENNHKVKNPLCCRMERGLGDKRRLVWILRQRLCSPVRDLQYGK